MDDVDLASGWMDFPCAFFPVGLLAQDGVFGVGEICWERGRGVWKIDGLGKVGRYLKRP